MKRIGQHILLFTISAIVFTACQKEFTLDEADPLEPPVSDSIYLDQVVELDSIGPSQFDTVNITRYQYDALKRVISMKIYWDDAGTMALMEEYLYTYNGSDTLPAKTTSHDYEYDGATSQRDTTTTWYFYSNGKLVKDSAIFVSIVYNNGVPVSAPTDTTVVSYVHTPLMVTSFSFYKDGSRFNPSNTQEYIERDTATLDGRGNIITSKKYLTDDNGATWDLDISSVFTYDMKPSPFSRISNFRTLYQVAPPETYYFDMQAYNNRTSYRYDYGSGNTQEIDYSGYVYRPDGLPVSVRSGEPGMTAERITKFLYKAL